MDRIRFFDCNCSYGRRAVVNPGSFFRLEELVGKMEHYGIEKALVYHSLARENSPAVGNRMLREEIAEYSCMEAVWTVMPHHTGEFSPPEVFINEMKLNGARTAVMFPSAADHGYSLSEWNCGDLLGALEQYGIPLIIGLEQFAGSWDGVHGLCSSHPQLKMILTGVNYRTNRNLYPIMKKFSNIYIELSGYKVHSGIEEVCELFGAKRLVFGTGMPVYSGGSAVSMLNYARISPKEKQMIAFANLEELLGGARL